MDLSDIAQHLHLTAPLVAASPIYGLFKFLDRKASQAANRAVTAWIKGERYKQIDLKRAVVEGFDHLYGTPLLSWRSFLRSACLSALSAGTYLTFIVFLGARRGAVTFEEYDIENLAIGLFATFCILGIPTIISDYISLFAVRKCLTVSAAKLTSSILLAVISAAGAITLAILILGRLFDVVGLFANLANLSFERPEFGLFAWIIATLPGLLVHIWLPLLLVAGTITSALVAFFRVAGFAQWFSKKGSSHPYDAIGIVAAAVVFVGTAVWQGVSYFTFA